VHKILLFYRFTPVADPDAIRLWQRDLCESLGVRGRILISKDGINGTVGGELKSIKRYVRKTREYPAFKSIDFGWNEGTGNDFPRLSVRVRDELVSFGAPGELRVDDSGVVGGGQHLTPSQLHELVAQKEVTFFDGRNSFEAALGRFRGAVVPDVEHTRDFIRDIDSGAYDGLKNEPVVTYCTGGIRCEVLSSLLINRGFREVYQLEGGIARYGETFGDSGLWEGSLYVFDERKSIAFSDDPAVLGRCYVCAAPTSRMENCGDPSCHEQLVVCDDHAADAACDVHVVNSGKINV
jgi:UPF0176 protein